MIVSSSANVFVTDSSSVTVSGASSAYAISLTDSANNGSITLDDPLTTTGPNILQSGTNGNIYLNANLSGSSVTISASGSGSIMQSTGAIQGNTINLTSGTGNLGLPNQILQITAGLTVSANTGGTGGVYLSGLVPVLNNSSSGADFQLTTPGSVTVNSIFSVNGGITVCVSTGLLKVGAKANIVANSGNVTLQNSDGTLGKIFIDAGATIQAAQNFDSAVLVFLGPAPPPQNAGSTPSNVTATTSAGGQIFFGTNGFAANPGNNIVYASGTGADIIFDTGAEGASAITLNGGTTIYANAHQFTPLTSLDLTNKATVSLITSLQSQHLIGGQLIVTNGIATGGTLALVGGELGNLTAMNIPSNVQVTLDDFQTFNAIDVNLTSTSTTKQVVINGDELFTGTPTTNAVMNITSYQIGTVLNTGISSLVNTSGTLTINAGGNIIIGGGLAGAVNLATTANNGKITLNNNVGTAGSPFGIALNGSGSLTQASGKVISASTLTIATGSGSIGSTSTAVKTQVNSLSASGSAVINLTNTGAINVLGVTASFFKITTSGALTTSGVINAPTVLLSNAAISGAPAADLNIGANIIAATSDTLASKGNIVQSNGLLSGNALTLTASNGDIGFASAIDTNVQSLTFTAGGGIGNTHVANIANTGYLKVLEAAAGELAINNAGNLTTQGAITANSVTLATSGNGAIVLGANVGLANGTTTIVAGGSGTLTQTAGLVAGGHIILGSLTSTGSIGTAAKGIATAASSTLTLDTSATGNVYDTNNKPVQLNSSQAGGNFSVTATGGLTVNNVTTSQGAVMLTSIGGVLQINGGTTDIVDQGGNITLQNTNTTTGSISIGSGATIHAIATAAGVGVVNIVVGSTPPPLVQGPTPLNVIVTTEPGGQVYFGTKGITATAPNNQVNANGRNVVFSTGGASATKINLGGGVTITADPPADSPVSYHDNLQNADDPVVDTGDSDLNNDDTTVDKASP